MLYVPVPEGDIGVSNVIVKDIAQTNPAAKESLGTT